MVGHSCLSVLFVFGCTHLRASQAALVVKKPLASAGDMRDVGSVPGLGGSSDRGHGNPLQYSCLESPMDRGAWRAESVGLQRGGHNGSDLAHMCLHI